MISLLETDRVHKILIEKFGGSQGIRDTEALSSALSRPFQTFDGKELYPSVLHKAAALLESILSNHPFVDGNKRTGYVLTRLFLMQNDFDISGSQQEKYDFVLSIAWGERKFPGILDWLEKHTIKLNR